MHSFALNDDFILLVVCVFFYDDDFMLFTCGLFCWKEIKIIYLRFEKVDVAQDLSHFR
jgi:hypothetical protein